MFRSAGQTALILAIGLGLVVVVCGFPYVFLLLAFAGGMIFWPWGALAVPIGAMLTVTGLVIGTWLAARKFGSFTLRQKGRLVAGLLIASLALFVYCATRPIDGTWTSLAPSGPSPDGRRDLSAAWATAEGRLLVYNGGAVESVSDLWSYRPATNTWEQLSQNGPQPSGRHDQSVVWDGVDGELLLFGGAVGGGGGLREFDDMWAFQLASGQWTQVAPNGGVPAARFAHTAVWDAADSQMLMFGGFSRERGMLNDLWSYRPATNTWEQLIPVGELPEPRRFQSAIWDPADGQMLVFGGVGFNGPYNDLWSYRPATNAWVLLHPGGSMPEARVSPGAVWDGARDRMLIFGGCCVPMDSLTADQPRSDLWSYEPANDLWSELRTSGTPAADYANSAVWDPDDGQMLVFSASLFKGLWSYRPSAPPRQAS